MSNDKKSFWEAGDMFYISVATALCFLIFILFIPYYYHDKLPPVKSDYQVNDCVELVIDGITVKTSGVIGKIERVLPSNRYIVRVESSEALINVYDKYVLKVNCTNKGVNKNDNKM